MTKKSISFEPLPHIYPNSTGLKIEDIKIPKNLQKYINKLEKVRRYNDGIHQEKGMIPDNSKAHTIRCVYYAKTIPLNGHVERMLWVHDIPELGLESDANAVGRFHNPQAASQTEKEERKLAEKLLSKKDLKLYKQFQTAEIFLKGTSKNPPEMQDALIARAIDFIDGNLVFHYFFTKWLGNNKYKGSIPPKRVFKFALHQNELYRNIISEHDINKKVLKAIGCVLDEQLKQILNIWGNVKESKIPRVMKKELIKIRNEINK